MSARTRITESRDMPTISPGYRQPNVCVTQAEAAWLEEAAEILRGKDVSDAVRRKAAPYVARIAKEARR